MNRSEFVIAVAIVLFVTFLLGWFAHWLLHRFSRTAGADMNEFDRLSRELHEAEEVRDQAIAYYQARESELANRLVQTEAELRAAMEGLRDARVEAEGLKEYVERESASDEPALFLHSPKGKRGAEHAEAEDVEPPTVVEDSEDGPDLATEAEVRVTEATEAEAMAEDVVDDASETPEEVASDDATAESAEPPARRAERKSRSKQS